ncbi:hypothetical protein GCM10011611_48740 [Aliidongia dinghuensis]|uniref:Type II secretion system protein GspC N-terminal domain-containing protein n=1 Tax=Aliidongia dinghuensis TaxID=1867774 RepID=A0A8J3E5Z4_9PROT|nr:hypothetical protein [Aliidongia dinghuensis]GGF36513.1 hypothetical protein GCM10011611_48740 [Aliidongia dinghuensis]
MRLGRSNTLAWAAACVLLAAVIGAEWQTFGREPASPEPSRTTSPSAAPAPPSAATSLGPLEAYAAVTQRPLFSQSRRPPASGDAALSAVEQHFKLTGILTSGPERIALVRPENDRKLLRVHEGETLGGWTVRSIASDRLVLTGSEGEAVLLLRDKPARR